MPSEEKTLEYAREKGWDKIFEKAKNFHSLREIETTIGRKISDVEIRAMCSLGLAQLTEKREGGLALVVTELGLKLLDNKPSEEFVELWYRYKKYLVRKSDLENKGNKILMLPDGTALDLARMYVDTTDKHGNLLKNPCLRGSNSEYETFGQLPVIGVIQANPELTESILVNKQELQEALWLIEQKWRPDFLKFIETGEASNEFLDYLDSNSDAQRAVGLVTSAQIRAFEYVGKILKVHRLVNHYFRGQDVQKWLNFPHPMLNDRTPKFLMNEGHADAVLQLLESVRDGLPL